MPTPTMRDPKQVLDEAIDEAFARAKSAQQTIASVKNPIAELLPAVTRRQGLISWVVAASAALSVLGAFVTLFVTRRRTPAPKTRFLFGKPARRFGYGRYHIGRFGTAYIAYTYKLPEVRYHLPPITYKLPPIRVKLPLTAR
jgi:hypothetical protein